MSKPKYGLLAADDEYLFGHHNLAWIKSQQVKHPGSIIVVKGLGGVWRDLD